MSRHFSDWLKAYVDYASYGEAPLHMCFWAGVAAVAGALRRRVWIDEKNWKWYPNFYIVLTAPPGIVSKSSTASIAMDLLREVPGVCFGPEVATWQSLVSGFEEVTESFDCNGEYHAQSALTFESSEFGNLLDTRDLQMVNLFIRLYDGKQGEFKKTTKHSGNSSIENPWLNFVACTTPSWIAQNFPEYMLSGGFVSRCLFVYAEKKRQLCAYLSDVIPPNYEEMKQKLIDDLRDIAIGPLGEYKLSREAKQWGNEWYYKHNTTRPLNLTDERFGGYIARKQTHIHKLAMVLAASCGNRMIIEAEHLQVADQMITDLEPDMAMVFSKIGKSDYSFYADRLLAFIQGKKEVKYTEAYQHVHSHFPLCRDFEDIILGLSKAGLVRIEGGGQNTKLKAVMI